MKNGKKNRKNKNHKYIYVLHYKKDEEVKKN